VASCSPCALLRSSWYATVEVVAGAVRGQFAAEFWADQLVRFRDQLLPHYERLVGCAKFVPLEDWLSIEVEGDGNGHFRAKCIACDYPGLTSPEGPPSGLASSPTPASDPPRRTADERAAYLAVSAPARVATVAALPRGAIGVNDAVVVAA
jgi:hypothetical protein